MISAAWAWFGRLLIAVFLGHVFGWLVGWLDAWLTGGVWASDEWSAGFGAGAILYGWFRR